jgi:hypothetical protein
MVEAPTAEQAGRLVDGLVAAVEAAAGRTDAEPASG